MDYEQALKTFEENADYRTDYTGEKALKFIAAGRCLCLLPNIESGGIFGVKRAYNLEWLNEAIKEAEMWRSLTLSHYGNGGYIGDSIQCEGIYGR